MADEPGDPGRREGVQRALVHSAGTDRRAARVRGSVQEVNENRASSSLTLDSVPRYGRYLLLVKREDIEAVMRRKISDAEWLVACDLLHAIECHPDGEAVMDRCIDHSLSVEDT